MDKLLLLERLGVECAAMNLQLADLELKLVVALILFVLHCVRIIVRGIYFAKLSEPLVHHERYQAAA